MKTLCAAVLFASMAVAQSVPVVALKPQDVEKVRSTRQAMLDAEKAWTDLQTEITNRYLIVDKDDPDASNEKWYPLEQTSGSGTITWSTAGTTATILTTSQLSQDECDPKAVAERKQWKADEDKREQEREAKSRRYRRGWTLGGSNCIDCGTKEFEYSSDWKYILPKSPTPSPVQPIQPWTITPSLSVGQPTPGSLILDGQI